MLTNATVTAASVASAYVTNGNPAAVATAAGTQGVTSLGAIHQATPQQKLAMATQASKDFEAFFVTSMMEFMYTGMKPNKTFGGGSGEEMYRSLLNQEYGKVAAERDMLGISDVVRSEMLRLQEKH